MELRNVGAVQLDLPVEDKDIYPGISKDKTRTRNQRPDPKEGKVGYSLLSSQPLNNARLKDIEEEKEVRRANVNALGYEI